MKETAKSLLIAVKFLHMLPSEQSALSAQEKPCATAGSVATPTTAQGGVLNNAAHVQMDKYLIPLMNSFANFVSQRFLGETVVCSMRCVAYNPTQYTTLGPMFKAKLKIVCGVN